ncbi:MAG: hypothetical protein JW719_02870 [Pirellulales bacterium]|nr:hypothetical protein [Pirellulales bacterium]
MTNLAKPWLMYLKAALLALVAMISCGLILLEHPRWHVAGLLVLAIWSSARVYYFMFYVIEKYVDPSYRFSGIASFVRYACSRRGVQQISDVDDRDRQSSA